MDPSQTNINLHPERRRQTSNHNTNDPLNPTETSPYFGPSKTNSNRHNHSNNRNNSPRRPDENGRTEETQRRRSGRQTVLSFTSNGQLSSKISLVNPISRSDPRRQILAETATETLSLLPGLLATRPEVGTAGYLTSSSYLQPVTSNTSPNLPPTKIRILNSDTIDAALSLPPSTKPPCILNMANADHAGGGFKHGALAQEEALCYRSSLIFTLKLRYYPIPEEAAIYSPSVLVFRNSLSNGHDILDLRDPSTLPVISVVSAAAICQPRLKPISTPPANSTGVGNPPNPHKRIYANTADKNLMTSKMRVILRVCIRNHHRNIILGAFGCGAFGNPPEEVARLWKEVLQEKEFYRKGWWENLVFAVLDGKGDDNWRVFDGVLGGLEV